MKTMVRDAYGNTIDFEAAVTMMDDTLREELHRAGDAATEQEFFNQYCEMHEVRFGEAFEACVW